MIGLDPTIRCPKVRKLNKCGEAEFGLKACSSKIPLMCDISCRGSWAAFDRSGGREQLVAGKHGRASMGLTAGGEGGGGGGGGGGDGQAWV